jgi:two-component system NtrC family sensor kinase
MRDQARSRGWRSLTALPLLNRGAIIGAIAVTRAKPGALPDDDIQLLRTFADQAVIAIENARLLNDIREALQQQTATADVLKVISRSAFDLQTVFDTLIKSAVELVGALNGTICLRDGDGYRYLATSGIQSEFAKFLAEHPPKPGRASAAGRVILSGRVESIPDVLADPDYIVPAFDLNKTRSVLGVPLLRDERVEGALVLARAEPGSFKPRQIEIVQTFADQAVIAIENVRLFEEVQERTRELAASLDDLRKAQDRLVQTEKLASLGQLTAGIAHEIKNPLNFVNNFSALSRELLGELSETIAIEPFEKAQREDAEDLIGMVASNLDKVVTHGKRADSIVKNMLLHSREGSGTLASANVNAMVEDALNLAYHGARAEKPDFKVNLEKSLDPNAGVADLFPQELTRVLLNLISNGFYATTKRRLSEPDSAYEPTVLASTRNLGDRIEITIRDNGTGIPDDVKAKIFNPFFTTKPAGEGTGLGLSLSHDIVVKQHGGTLEVATEPGVFTQFTIVLPRASRPQEAARGPS